MTKPLTRRLHATLIVAAILAAGCGDWWLRITEVSGTIRIDGKPAHGVRVVFQPFDASRPRALAQTDTNGVYRLGRQGPGNRQGAAAGRYKVQLLTDTDSPNAVAIAPEYNVRTTLEFDVVPGRANVFDVEVKTKK
ncbi:MAG: hypothetical protein ACKO4T_01235 [Planctomycetaceae bacterium]